MFLTRNATRLRRSPLARQTVAYGFTNAVAAVIPMAVGPILTHYLDPSDYAIAALLVAAFNILAPPAGLGIQGAFRRRYYDEQKAEFAPYVWSASLVSAAGTVALTGLAFASYPLWGSDTVPRVWSLAFLPWMLGQSVLSTASALLQLQGRPIAFGVLTWVQALAQAATSLALVVGFGMAWQGRALGVVVASSVVGLWGCRVIHRVLGGGYRFRRGHAEDALRIGVPGIPYAMLDRVMASADRVLLAWLVGVEPAGFYVLGAQVSGLTTRGSTALLQAWQPWLFGQLQDGSPRALRRVAYALYLGVAGMIALGLVVWGLISWVFPLVVGERYQPALPLIPWICVGLALRAASRLFSMLILYAEKTGYLARIAVVSGLLNLTSSAGLILMNGTVGAAQGLLLSYAVGLILTWRIARKLVTIPGI